MARPFAVIGFTLFIVSALLFEFEIGVTVTALAVFIAALVLCIFIRNVRKQGFLPVIFASGAVACALLLCETYFVYYPAMEYDGRSDCVISAELTSLPEIRYGNYYYEARTVSVNGEDAELKLRLVFSTPPEAEPYDIIEGKFNLYALGSSEEELLQSYKSRGVFLGAYPSDEGYSVINVAESEKPFAKKIVDLREGIKKAVYRILPDKNGALAVALIIGDKSGLPNDIYSDFRTIGISHIICVSGFHLSLWSMFILKILKKTRLDFRISNLIACVGVVVFMLIAGLTYSVVRAGIMMIICLLGNTILRKSDSLNSLGIALAVLTVSNPFSIGAVSLQLSVLATTGIILYSLYIEPDINRLTDKIKRKSLSVKVRKTISTLMVTVSATAFTLPVALSLNSSFNFLCFAANFVAVPLAGWCMITCAAGALFGVILPSFYNLFADVGRLLCKLLIGLSDWFSGLDFLTFRVSTDKIIFILCGIFVLCLATVFISTFKKPIYSVAAAVCAAVFTVCIVAFSFAESAETKISVIDCGNGTSVLISCGGENVLIGCGGTEFLGASEINNAVTETGGRLSAVFVSDSDESAGSYLYDVLSVRRPEKIYYDELPNGIEFLTGRSEVNSFCNSYATENILAKPFNFGNNYCVYIKTNDISAVICLDPSFSYNLLPEALRDVDVVISRSNFPADAINCTDSLFILNADKKRAENAQKLYGAMGNRFLVTGGNGNIILRAESGAFSVTRE